MPQAKYAAQHGAKPLAKVATKIATGELTPVVLLCMVSSSRGHASTGKVVHEASFAANLKTHQNKWFHSCFVHAAPLLCACAVGHALLDSSNGRGQGGSYFGRVPLGGQRSPCMQLRTSKGGGITFTEP